MDDLIIDEKLTDLERICKYSFSAINLQRLLHVKRMAQIAKSEGVEITRARILPLIPRLLCDDESLIKQSLAEQIGIMGATFLDIESGYSMVTTSLIPHLATLVTDPTAEVRLAASKAIVETAEHLHADDLGPLILTIVLQLAHNQEKEEYRMTSSVLLNELAQVFGEDLCHQFVIPEIISLSEDQRFKVRKSVAISLDKICKVAGDDYVESRLLPAFRRLSEDSCWSVRKGCAESIHSVSSSVSTEIRVKYLLPIVKALIDDPTKWVKNALYQNLGAFIALTPSSHINSHLLKTFTSMASHPSEPENPNYDQAYLCSYSFPGVMKAAGESRWSELKPAFDLLSANSQWRVRRPLAFSLHEIARVLGPKVTEQDLLKTFDSFLRDTDNVKSGIVEHLSDFMECLTPECRESYLPILPAIQSEMSPLNWRFRELLATQLPKLSNLFSPPATFSVIATLCINLLNDVVIDVRKTTFQGIPPLIFRLCEEDKSWEPQILERFIDFSTKPHYQDRVIYVNLATHLSARLHSEMFIEYFLPPLLKLAHDPVPNIRYLIARLFTTGPEWLKSHEQVISSNQTLQCDVDRDVRSFYPGSQPPVAPKPTRCIDAAPSIAVMNGVDEQSEGCLNHTQNPLEPIVIEEVVDAASISPVDACLDVLPSPPALPDLSPIDPTRPQLRTDDTTAESDGPVETTMDMTSPGVESQPQQSDVSSINPSFPDVPEEESTVQSME